MKQFFPLFGLVCLIAMLLPACAPEQGPEPAAEPLFDRAAEEAAIRSAEAKGHDAWNAHDAKAIAA